MVRLIQAKRSPVISGRVMAAVVASALVPLVVQFAGGGRSDVASIGATFRGAPVLVGLHLVTDVLIGLSYVAIAATLMPLARKAKQDMPVLWAFVAFGIAILSCGRGSAVMDECGLLLPATTALGATWVADKLLMALEQPFVLDGHRFMIEASVGIDVYPQHGGDVTTLVRRADMAMPAPAAERAADAGCGHLLQRVIQ